MCHIILYLKSNYCLFVEKLLLTSAYGMEYLFDGEKEWFGRRPDLTGFYKKIQDRYVNIIHSNL